MRGRFDGLATTIPSESDRVPDHQSPGLKLTFMGVGFPRGAVPLNVVAEKLQALQKAVFHAAAAASGHSGQRRGQWFNRYRSVAELTFASSHHSDLTIEAALAVNPALRDDLDVGLHAIDLLFDVAAAVQTDTLSQVRPTLSQSDKDYLLRALEGLMPNVGNQYQVRLENGRAGRHPPVTFDAVSRTLARGYTVDVERPYEAEEEAVVVGELIKIYVDAGEDKITVRARQRDVDCFYGDALRDRVSNLIAGSTVEASGFATLDAADQVVRLHRLTDVVPVSSEPLRIARFEHEGRVYALRAPVAVAVEHADGLWVYHHPDLNLWGYAARREDALRDLHASFDYVYREFAEEAEERLDAVARQLRARLLSLGVTSAGDAVHA